MAPKDCNGSIGARLTWIAASSPWLQTKAKLGGGGWFSDNLKAWLLPIRQTSGRSACLAVLHDMARVALEAANSPQVIFGHYRELVTPEAANAWTNLKKPWHRRAGSNPVIGTPEQHLQILTLARDLLRPSQQGLLWLRILLSCSPRPIRAILCWCQKSL